jgi:AcrR family transcriptional regulator
MGPRMATVQVRIPASTRREQILDIATQFFARQGYEGTTTRQISQECGINEALIFRHFPTKDDLYWSVIERKIDCANPARRMQAVLHAGGSELEVFSGVAHEILERRSKDSTLSRLLLFSALEKHTLSERFLATYAADYYENLADYIRHRINQGQFRATNPLLAARAFVGMVIYHSWIQEIFGGKRHQDFDLAEVSRTLAEIWLQGMSKKNGSMPNGTRKQPQRSRKRQRDLRGSIH